MLHSILYLYLCLLGYSSQISTPDDDSYVAAVVEYQVQANTSVNLQNYIQFIQDAAEQNADIIVFPELTLAVRENVVVPINSLLKEYPIPVLQPTLYDEILVSISSAARQNQIYVVINLEERVDCSSGNVPGESCPEQKVYLFNTNVVYDRTGAIIDRYRKINLFGEYTRTPALSPDLGIFNTDFGVTFGHYICFDLMFQVPSIQIVEKHNISDIIFPTMWFSEMPYLTAVQIQQAYAYTMNVNFLGAGANNVRIGSAGSGIYSGRAGALVSIMPGVPTSKLLVARVPKQPGQVSGTVQGPIYNEPSEQDDLYLITDPSLASHTTRILNPGSSDIILASGDVVCHFRVQYRQGSGENPFYRVFAHDGVNVYAKRDVGTAGCLLVACKTEDVKSCVYRFSGDNEGSVEITNLQIELTSLNQPYNTTLKCDDIKYYPISLRNNKLPLDPKDFSYIVDTVQDEKKLNELTEKKERSQITHKINLPQTDLVAFGVWGRIFNRDGEIPTDFSKEDIDNYIEIENIIYNIDNKNRDRGSLLGDEL